MQKSVQSSLNHLEFLPRFENPPSDLGIFSDGDVEKLENVPEPKEKATSRIEILNHMIFDQQKSQKGKRGYRGNFDKDNDNPDESS